jgi:hypothetical protein
VAGYFPIGQRSSNFNLRNITAFLKVSKMGGDLNLKK